MIQLPHPLHLLYYPPHSFNSCHICANRYVKSYICSILNFSCHIGSILYFSWHIWSILYFFSHICPIHFLVATVACSIGCSGCHNSPILYSSCHVCSILYVICRICSIPYSSHHISAPFLYSTSVPYCCIQLSHLFHPEWNIRRDHNGSSTPHLQSLVCSWREDHSHSHQPGGHCIHRMILRAVIQISVFSLYFRYYKHYQLGHRIHRTILCSTVTTINQAIVFTGGVCSAALYASHQPEHGIQMVYALFPQLSTSPWYS
jgi:hypothetical protein